MGFDFNRTLALVKGGLTNPSATWESYLAENPAWQQTLVNITGPLLLANVVLGLIFSRMVGTATPYGLGGSLLGAMVMLLILTAIGFAVAVFIFNFLAGVFGGKPDFNRCFAGMSLAAIPAWLAGIVGALLPWIGPLVSLAGGIVSLVFLYRVLPLAVAVPDNKRVLHFIVSLVAVLVVNMIVAGLLGVGYGGSGPSAP